MTTTPAEDQRAQLEIEQIRANISKLINESSKFKGEREKLDSDKRWRWLNAPTSAAIVLAALFTLAGTGLGYMIKGSQQAVVIQNILPTPPVAK